MAHGVWLSTQDRTLLAEHGVTLVHNPVSNWMLGSGALDVRAALEARVPLALGTDSANTGGRHDLFEIMRHMLSAGRHAGSDYDRWVTPMEAFRAATGGVRALAGEFARAVCEAHAPPRWSCTAPIDRPAVRGAAPELRALAASLTLEAPAAAQGVALASQLLRNPYSPLYRPGNEHALRVGAKIARRALD